MSVIRSQRQAVATFSIVAFDPDTGDLGVAAQSKFLGVGAVVPFARAGVGAVATQSWANTSYGPRGLALMAENVPVEQVLAELTGPDDGRALRQVGIVNAHGQAAAFTGEKCYDWAGHVTGPNFACQGNILVGEDTVQAMAESFQNSTGELTHRLVQALAAGQAAGGDRRGQQSACLLVVRENGGYGGFNDRYCDLRVDNHPDPITELHRLLDLFDLYFKPASENELVRLTPDLIRDIQQYLHTLGYYRGVVTSHLDEPTRTAMRDYFLSENFDEHVRDDDCIDTRVVNYMQWQASTRSASN